MRSRPTWLGVGLLLFAGAVAVRLWAHQWLEPSEALAVMRRAAATGWGVPAYFTAYLVGSSLLIPAVGFHVVAGALFGFGPGVLWSLVAVNVVSNLHFLAGRALGRERVVAFLTARGWHRLQDELAHHGVLAMVALRQLPLPFVGVNLMAGASGVRWRDFAIGSGVGVLPPLVVYTYFATSLIDGVEGARGAALLRAGLGGLGMLALAVLPRLLQPHRERRDGERRD